MPSMMSSKKKHNKYQMYRGFFSDYRLNVVGEIIDMIVKSKGKYNAKIEKKLLNYSTEMLKTLVISKIFFVDSQMDSVVELQKLLECLVNFFLLMYLKSPFRWS